MQVQRDERDMELKDPFAKQHFTGKENKHHIWLPSLSELTGNVESPGKQKEVFNEALIFCTSKALPH